jgi:hypothetical protein
VCAKERRKGGTFLFTRIMPFETTDEVHDDLQNDLIKKYWKWNGQQNPKG